MRITSKSPRTRIVRVGPALDHGLADRYRVLLNQHIDKGCRKIVFDFNATELVDSTGLGVVLSVYRRLQGLGGEVVFAGIDDVIRPRFQRVGAGQVIEEYPSVERAVEAVKKTE